MKQFSAPKIWDTKSNVLSLALYPLTFLYKFIFFLNKIRQSLFKKKFKIKIICVGNIYVGGTGKTPLTKLIYQILSKNYKCCTIKKYRDKHMDEINFLKDTTNLISHKSRLEALNIAEKEGYEIAILDDGLQDYSFETDLKILCVKSTKGFGNGRVLPSGPLREPLSAIQNCKIAVINGEKNTKLSNFIESKSNQIKVLFSKYQVKDLQEYLDNNFLAFCGIADNQSFFDLLKENDIPIFQTKEFPDHHHFSREDIKELLNLANKKNAKLLTTEKNYHSLSPDLRKAVQFVALDLVIENFEEVLNEIN